MRCARKGCGSYCYQPVTGRPRRTCSDACRAAAYRARRRKRPAVWSSETVEWYTPPEVLAELVAEFGAFDLDPCADPRSPIWSAIAHHFTVDDDGLSLPWFGAVFMNPPYGRAIGQWMRKAAEEVASGRASLVVCLVPARTDTAWWHTALRSSGAKVRYREGRIRFVRADGTRGPGAAFPSAVIAFRDARSVTKGQARASSRVREAA